MATDLEAPPETDESAAAPKPKGGLLKIVVIVLAVVVVQGVATYFLLPVPEEKEELPTESPDAEVVEVPIDKFSTTNSSAEGQRVHITVEVVAIVAADQQHVFDEAANTKHKARVRMAVNKVIRSANTAELGEPGWNTMRRRMREDVNKLLRKSYVVEIVFPHYQTVEQ